MRRLRMAAPGAFAADPLRVLRLVRMVVELGLEPEAGTLASARESAAGLRAVSVERVFAELRRIVAARDVRRGIELMGEIGASAAVLPELEALRGVQQNRFHHTDVYEHTLETLDWAVTLGSGLDPAQLEQRPQLALALGGCAASARSLLREPLADEMSRGEALRWGALMHDAAKPLTRGVARAGGALPSMATTHAAPSWHARRSAVCAPASACARTSRPWYATTCAWDSSSTSRSRSRAAPSMST